MIIPFGRVLAWMCAHEFAGKETGIMRKDFGSL